MTTDRHRVRIRKSLPFSDKDKGFRYDLLIEKPRDMTVTVFMAEWIIWKWVLKNKDTLVLGMGTPTKKEKEKLEQIKLISCRRVGKQ